LVTIQTGARGLAVKRLLVEETIDIEKEYYLSLTLDRRTSRYCLIASAEGGMDIEEVARTSPEKIYTLYIDPFIGIKPYHARRVAVTLELKGKLIDDCVNLIQNLYKLLLEKDCSLVEINPLVVSKDQQLIAMDCKINFDDNALFRHPDYEKMVDLSQLDPLEIQARKYDLAYIKLNGNIGCMVNGAGLAMATLDILKEYKAQPANFLDVGGGANAQTVEAGFKIILKDENVKAILINIFGGIVRCDRVATGVVEAAKKVDVQIPIVIRLAGTNAELAAEILQNSGLKFLVARNLKEAAQKVTSAIAT
jgi:succinyl-CoA synthetase beta subunit